MNEFVTVFITSPDRERSVLLAETLVKERLAACVNVVPGLVSVYRWQGEIHEDPEELLIAKTRTSLLGTLTNRVHELHPYELPEIIALPIVGGSEPYRAWIANETRSGA